MNPLNAEHDPNHFSCDQEPQAKATFQTVSLHDAGFERDWSGVPAATDLSETTIRSFGTCRTVIVFIRIVRSHLKSNPSLNRATAKLSASPLYSATDSFDVYIANRPMASNATDAAFAWGIWCQDDIDREHDPKSLRYYERYLHERSNPSSTAARCTRYSHTSRCTNFCQLILDFSRISGFPPGRHEGYCEYVAGDPSFDATRGQELIRSGTVTPIQCVSIPDLSLCRSVMSRRSRIATQTIPVTASRFPGVTRFLRSRATRRITTR